MDEQVCAEGISIKPFEWKHWVPFCQLGIAQLAEDGIILDSANIPKVPPKVPAYIDPSDHEWDLDYIGEAYLRRAGGFWLAWHGEMPVGRVGAQDLGGVVELRRMYVMAQYRRRGAGTHLVEALIKHCMAKGVRAIELWTAKNGLGQLLYEKLGFCISDEPGPGFEDVGDLTGYSPGADEIRMRLDLAEVDG